MREYFGDDWEDWGNTGVTFEERLSALSVSGWLVPNDTFDPFGVDFDRHFVFTAYDEELAGDHGLYVFVDRDTGEIDDVTEFN